MITARLGKILPRYKISKKLQTHADANIEIEVDNQLSPQNPVHD
jgi:hypothetical protein